MNYVIRDLDQNNNDEMDLVVNRTMETVIETIPEFEGKKKMPLRFGKFYL